MLQSTESKQPQVNQPSANTLCSVYLMPQLGPTSWGRKVRNESSLTYQGLVAAALLAASKCKEQRLLST